MNNTTKYYSLIIAVVVLFAMMTVSCEKSPVDKGTDETDRMIDIRTSIEALTKSPALDGNGEGNFSNGDIFTLVVSGSGFPNIDTSYTVGTTDLSWADLNLPEDAVVFQKVCLCRRLQICKYNNSCFQRDTPRRVALKISISLLVYLNTLFQTHFLGTLPELMLVLTTIHQ